MSLVSRVRQHAWFVHLCSALLAIASLLAISWWLPVNRALIELRGLLEHVGPFFGPLALLVLYVLANLALVPGLLVMMLAGAVLSPAVALITMSIGTAIAAAAGFLVARNVARGPIERMAQNSRRVAAIREAVAEGGFGILVLLRLTPVVPYGFSNYAFGLTTVSLGAFVAASWIAMLPTTLLYVLLGYTGGESIVALQSGLRLPGDGPLELTLVALGFAIRWAGVWYVARRTRQRLDRTRHLAATEPQPPLTTAGGWPLAVVLSSSAAGLLVVVAIASFAARDVLVALPGPEPVVMAEAYTELRPALVFDHAIYDELLAKHVDDAGLVDYTGLQVDAELLDRYLERIAEAPFDRLGRDEKLALLLNAYNAFTLRLVLDHWPVVSILEIPFDRRWEGRTWNVGGNLWTLSQIEQDQCRGSFVEPRIHFALCTASLGGPPLWNRAYRGEAIDEQLEARAWHLHGFPRWFVIDEEPLTPTLDLEVGLTRLYAWYRGDFEQVAEGILPYAARYSPRLGRALETRESLKIFWLPYDWSLNALEASGKTGDDQ